MIEFVPAISPAKSFSPLPVSSRPSPPALLCQSESHARSLLSRGAMSGIPRRSFASILLLPLLLSPQDLTSKKLPADAYVELSNGMRVCRLQVGMLQMSPKTSRIQGGSGYWEPRMDEVVADMQELVRQGFNTFDSAMVYGMAEEAIAVYCDRYRDAAASCVFNTKLIPTGSSGLSEEEIRAALLPASRARGGRLDLVHVYWWDFDKHNYIATLLNAQRLVEEQVFKGIALTGFDSLHVQEVIEAGVRVAAVQLSLSVVDTRALDGRMQQMCRRNGIAMFAHGTLLGGFLSEEWMGKEEPKAEELETSQLRKYLRWVRLWGSWELLQEMLVALRAVAERHGVTVAVVAMRWAMQQEGVASVVVGTRMGMRGKLHLEEKRRALEIELDDKDMAAIAQVQRKGRSLTETLGDCGDEFHVKNRRKTRG
eukprot:768629-Hanusia_phi.AAC.12